MLDKIFKSFQTRLSGSIHILCLIPVLLIILIPLTSATLCMTGCQIISSEKTPTKGVSLTSSGSMTGTSSGSGAITSEITDSTNELEVPIIPEPREVVEISKPAVNAEGFVFQPLSIKKRYLIDLNSDGIKEKVEVAPDEKQEEYCVTYNLIINNVKTCLFSQSDDWSQTWLVLTDLDKNDSYLDLLHIGGTFDWIRTSFYYFNGKQTVARGEIWDCFFKCVDINSVVDYLDQHKPVSLLTQKLNGCGQLIQDVPGSVLCDDWTYKQTWVIGKDGMLNSNPQTGYIPIAHSPVKLKMDLPLYSSPAVETVSFVVPKGEYVTLIKTDNKKWIEIKTQKGKIGWFQVEDVYNVIIGSTKYFSPEVFDGIKINEG